MASPTCDFSALSAMEPAQLDHLLKHTFLNPAEMEAGHPANRPMRDFPPYCIFYAAPDASGDADYSHVWFTREDGDAHLVDALNAFLANYLQGDIPFVTYVALDTREVRIALLKDTPRPVLVYRGYNERIGTLAKCGDEISLPYVAKDLPFSAMPSSVFVPEDVTVLHICAMLFRKPPSKATEDYVPPKPFETSESLVLPAGTYASIDAIAEALNGVVKMRGERNGPVYLFMKSKKKRGVLRIAAHHRQPDPSFIIASPSEAGHLLGLAGPAHLVLGNKKYVDFHALPCGLIV